MGWKEWREVLSDTNWAGELIFSLEHFFLELLTPCQVRLHREGYGARNQYSVGITGMDAHSKGFVKVHMTYITTTSCRVCQTNLGVQICTWIRVRKLWQCSMEGRTIQIDLATIIMNDLTCLRSGQSKMRPSKYLTYIKDTIFEDAKCRRISDLGKSITR